MPNMLKFKLVHRYQMRIRSLGSKTTKTGSIGVLLIGSFLAIFVSASPAASADTLNYPWYNAPCEFDPNGGSHCTNPTVCSPCTDPSCTSSPNSCNDLYDWYENGGNGFTGTDCWYNTNSECFDGNSYEYRNCTSYTAWRLNQVGVASSKVTGLGNGGQWYNNAPVAERSTTPKAWDAAVVPGTVGHVAFVESVSTDGTQITVSEYNHDTQGNGDTRTGTPASMGFTEYVDFGVHPSTSKADIVVHDGTTTNWAVAVSTGSAFSGKGNWYTGWSAGDWTGIGDVSGDGKADIVVHDGTNSKFNVLISTGSSYSANGTWLSGQSAGDWTGLADVNGDGKADLVIHSGTTYSVALSNGSSFATPVSWRPSWGIGDWVGLADVNGDGKSDLLVHSSNAFTVGLSSGTGFGSNGTWLSSWGVGDWTGLADVNGDGKADIITHNPSGNQFNVATSTGTAFSGKGAWYSGWSIGDWAGAADVNGDGKADVVVHDGANSKFNVLVSTGSAFSANGTWITGWNAGDWAGLDDVNGS